MRKRWAALRSRYPILSSISTLLSGTVLAQLIVFAGQPIISRMYTDHDLGLLATFLAIPMTVSAVAALRYDMAIMLPEHEGDARKLLRFCLVMLGSVSVALSLTGVVFGEWIARAIGAPQLSPWMPLAGLIVFINGAIGALTFWLNRQVLYGAISSNRILTSGALTMSRIAAPLIKLGAVPGLLVSQIVGQGIGLLGLIFHSRKAIFGLIDGPTPTRHLLAQYRKMPLLNAPNALIDAFRLNGVIVILGYVYDAAAVGQFTQAWAIMQAPVTLISGAISQVFFQKFATTERGNLTSLVFSSVKVALAAAAIPFALLFVLAPWLLPLYLGPEWQLSGEIGRALVPWLFLTVATSPISTVFVVVNRQQDLLIFAIAYALVPLGLLLWIGPSVSISLMMWIMSGAMSLLLVVMIMMSVRVARLFDAGRIAA